MRPPRLGALGSAQETVKVLDLGIAKTALPSAGSTKLTRGDAVMGSARCMSPEPMLASADVDARTDVWSLGVILYELASGRLLEDCLSGVGLDFEFTMAFQSFVTAGTGSIFGCEALVRGPAGEGAPSILATVNDTNRYRFDRTPASSSMADALVRGALKCGAIADRVRTVSTPPRAGVGEAAARCMACRGARRFFACRRRRGSMGATTAWCARRAEGLRRLSVQERRPRRRRYGRPCQAKLIALPPAALAARARREARGHRRVRRDACRARA